MGIGAVGDSPESGPDTPLRIVEEFLDVFLEDFHRVAAGQLLQSLAAHVVAGHLGVNVTLDLDARPNILFDQRQQFPVYHALFNELDRWDL